MRTHQDQSREFRTKQVRYFVMDIHGHDRKSTFDPHFCRMLKYTLLSGFARAVSSGVEHCLHTAGVTGSTPVSPTMEPRGYTKV